MNKGRKFFHSFHTKVTVSLGLSLLLVMGVSILLIYQFALTEQMNQLRQRLMVIAQTATFSVDPDQIGQIPLDRHGIDTDPYKEVTRRLAAIKEVNPSIAYIYILTRTEQPGILQFISDPNPELEGRGRSGPSAFPGDIYDASRFPEMLRAFDEPSADKTIVTDEWGITLSGYAPIRDRTGKAVAILGVDMSAADVYEMRKEIHRRAWWVLVLGMLLSVTLGMFIAGRLAGRVEKIVEGTRRLAGEELDYKVEVAGHDEIAELADSFNKMATNLLESKKKLQDYFYRVVQSLVRILEAKDHYTRGHSERVALYAERIGRAMAFPEREVELLKKAALLHDIGKLVVHDEILNKAGPLSEEEWEIIRQHPVVGEQMLTPAFEEGSFLKMIRAHHERYDGKGYPDRSPGDATNIFAQIISVADAYDAMTTTRAYRRALSQETAIQELKQNSGTQFNPQVVDVFLSILS